jgi:predicted RNA polymerase sigma factor
MGGAASIPPLHRISLPRGIAASDIFSERLPIVHRALYLLFNVGYHGASPESAVRGELCREAMRLGALLLEHPLGSTPATYALSALICLHASRLPVRLDALGNLSSLIDQDRRVVFASKQ